MANTRGKVHQLSSPGLATPSGGSGGGDDGDWRERIARLEAKLDVELKHLATKADIETMKTEIETMKLDLIAANTSSFRWVVGVCLGFASLVLAAAGLIFAIIQWWPD